MEYELKENGEIKFTGTSQQCWDALVIQYGGHLTVADIIARNIIIEPKQ